MTIVKREHKTAADAENHLIQGAMSVFASDADIILNVGNVINAFYLEWNIPAAFHDTKYTVAGINDFF
jgi:hypothetical protein